MENVLDDWEKEKTSKLAWYEWPAAIIFYMMIKFICFIAGHKWRLIGGFNNTYTKWKCSRCYKSKIVEE